MPVKIVNKSGAPDCFFRAVAADPYSRGASDFSATSLLQPARAFVLLENNTVEVDVSTRVATTLGQGTHSTLERAKRKGDIIETRYFSNFIVDQKSYIVSAQVDLYEGDTKSLYDWKTTKAYAFSTKAGSKYEWEVQLNIGAYLMDKMGIKVENLYIIGLLKDWDLRKSQTEKGYPESPVVQKKIKLWTADAVVQYVEERIRDIVSARASLPKCSSKETWGGNRCSQWCDAKSVCEQYKETILTGLIGE